MADGKAGRPRADIDWRQFEGLCAFHCTESEIASQLRVDMKTLRVNALLHYGDDDFSSIYKRFQESGKCSLRRNQFVLSKKNAAMSIWLGKQYLEQKDNSKETEQILSNMAHFLSNIENTSKELVQKETP